MKQPLPENESARLRALHSCGILDTESEQEYDDIALLASQICGTPIATITLIDENRQWHKAKIGVEGSEDPREIAFCGHAILSGSTQPMVVQDALEDERFSNNPLVIGDPYIRFYAGAPLITPDNFAIGTLCVIDHKPRELTENQLESLQALARQVTLKLELRRVSILLQNANEDLKNLSLTDDLTGLYNRRGFLLHAEQQLKLFRSRQTEYGLWLMVADMDKLKPINDKFGHDEGSTAIIEISRILRKCFRESDLISRFGGDEFVVLINNALDNVKEKVPERLEKSLTNYNAASQKLYELSISYGLIPIDFNSTDSIEEIMRQADKAMYEHKRSKNVSD